MLCQSCEKNPATMHIKKVINGQISEISLCSHCARKMGYSHVFGNFGFNFGSLFDITPKTEKSLQTQTCPFCFATFEDIMQSGKVGCAECYETFRNRLLPYIQKINGNSKHCGKTPNGSTLQIAPKHEIQLQKSNHLDKIKEKLKEAIASQNFEEAVILRDRIQAIEGGQNDEMV